MLHRCIYGFSNPGFKHPTFRGPLREPDRDERARPGPDNAVDHLTDAANLDLLSVPDADNDGIVGSGVAFKENRPTKCTRIETILP